MEANTQRPPEQSNSQQLETARAAYNNAREEWFSMKVTPETERKIDQATVNFLEARLKFDPQVDIDRARD